MSLKGQALRDLVMERLVVAADEIFALFERTIAEYEEEALRSRLQLQEPRVERPAADVQTLLLHSEVGSEHTEEEQALYLKQEEKPPLGFPFTPFSVKTENNVDKSSLLHQEPAEASREDTVGEQCEEEEPGCSLDLPSENEEQTYSCSDTDDSEDWDSPTKTQTKCDGQETNSVHMKDSETDVHLVSREVGPCLLQQRPSEENREEPLEEQHKEEKPGCSLDVINLQSNSDAHSSSDTEDSKDWEPPTTEHKKAAAKRQNSNPGHLKGSKRGRAAQSRVFSKSNSSQKSSTLLKNNSGNGIIKTKLRCSECGKPFQREAYLQKHILMHSNYFRCHVCNKEFMYKSRLTAHMRSHTKEKPFSCSVCKKSFSQAYYLNRHMRIHTDGKPFSCPECGLRFRQQHNIFRHIAVIHRGEKPFSCPVCKKAFAQRRDYVIHLSIHSGEKPFSCTICNKRFGDKGYLRKHIKTHKARGED